ncbi:MAG TPA: sugar transferase [Butyricimonas virosa]|uniref:Sugar transferase n=1 Tax=Butyricimonas virosa TaxID=544645 RepID=A0A921H4E7_9BACT|nr:sugar transferase [Butyricimonas virosa]
MYKHFFKRCIDFVLVLGVLLVVWPILLVIAIWLHFANKGAGAFFLQERPGKSGKIFKVIKFKSMTDERDATGKLLPDKQRLTKVGRFIRLTSIDELPQLINVLKGDMSLIGPRPLAVVYLPYYNEDEKRRHDVRPGITGWAQVNGRKSITWDRKLAYDIEYVNNMSLWMDVKIFFLTVYKVFKRECVGVETSGVVNFHDYRIAQWKEQGRQDLIDEARDRRNR